MAFAWNKGQGALRYTLVVGKSPGGFEFLNSDVGQDLSVEVANLPTDGSTVYVRLFSRFESGWEFNDYEVYSIAGLTRGSALPTVQDTSTVILWGGMPSGGGQRASETLWILDIVGQPVVGHSASETLLLDSGLLSGREFRSFIESR